MSRHDLAAGDAALAALRRLLDQTAARSAVVASNLVNIDTPGYRSLEVVFSDLLEGRLSLEQTDTAHLPPQATRERGIVQPAPITRMRSDGNTVDVDLQMTLLGALRGRYTASAEMVRKRFALLAYAATDGRSSR